LTTDFKLRTCELDRVENWYVQLNLVWHFEIKLITVIWLWGAEKQVSLNEQSSTMSTYHSSRPLPKNAEMICNSNLSYKHPNTAKIPSLSLHMYCVLLYKQ
jgi:hypothetical protein